MAITRKGRTPSEESVRDRGRTIELVRRAGRSREGLVFTVRDVRQVMETSRALQLERPERLSNHVAALEGKVVRLVGQGDLIPNLADTKGGRKRYVLIERWREFKAGYRTLDDPEKVTMALHLAMFASGGESVPTSAVTAVIRSVPELIPESKIPTGSHLQNLAKRASPLARLVTAPGEGSRRWEPIGEIPEHPDFEAWRKRVRHSEPAQSGMLATGESTLHEILEALVELTVQAHRRSWSGGGRPIKANEIKETAAASERGRVLTSVLHRKGVTLGALLGDASRTSLRGVPRKRALVVKVPNPWSNTTYYDVPRYGRPELRAEYVTFVGLMEHSKDTPLHNHRSEVSRARKYLASTCPISKAIGAARCLVVRKRWRSLVDGLQMLDNAGHLKRGPREKVKERLRTMASMERSIQLLTVGIDDELERPVRDLGVDPHTVLDSPRPLLVAEEFAVWVPRPVRGNVSASEYLGNVVGLERYPNAQHIGPSGTTPRERSRIGVDRVLALTYIAEKVASPMVGLVRKAGEMLGPNLRSPELLELLLESGSPDDQRTALMGLALLGKDEVVRTQALVILGDPDVSAWRAEGAVYSLMLARQFRTDELPEWLHSCKRPDILAFLRPVVRQARAGRWLMRG